MVGGLILNWGNGLLVATDTSGQREVTFQASNTCLQQWIVRCSDSLNRNSLLAILMVMNVSGIMTGLLHLQMTWLLELQMTGVVCL